MRSPVLSNPHTHTQFCDASSSAEEMVLSAIAHGFHTLGFSSHSYYPPDTDWCLSKEGIPLYIDEVHRLQALYSARIKIRLGLELDYYSLGHMDLSPYEYLIGSVHDYLDPVSGKLYTYDYTVDLFKEMLDEAFHGDPILLAKTYYRDLVRLMQEQKPLILGHFDLITKFNETLHLFSLSNPVYRSLSSEALLACCESGCTVVEVNTGGIIRGYKKTPYPDPYYLKLLLEHHIPVMLSSDCHEASAIAGGFDQMASLLAEIGFKSVLELGPDNLLIETPLGS
ncbi:MAG: histidinol-phosphatase [Firmicutes bacterium]|nr:histidinol-phosphatase [Bacillota bacterium]